MAVDTSPLLNIVQNLPGKVNQQKAFKFNFGNLFLESATDGDKEIDTGCGEYGGVWHNIDTKQSNLTACCIKAEFAEWLKMQMESIELHKVFEMFRKSLEEINFEIQSKLEEQWSRLM